MGNNYKKAVDSIPSAKPCYRAGLRALGSYSKYVQVSDTPSLNGSVFLDDCLKGENIWDYTFGYGDQSYYLEIHPAETGQVETVINKLKWLKNWLQAEGAPLNAINAPDPYRWVASGRVSILPGTTYDKRLAKAGLAIPKTRLSL